MEELSGKRNKVSYTALLALVTGIMTCYLAFFKLRLGLRGDDFHMMVTADAILRDPDMLKITFLFSSLYLFFWYHWSAFLLLLTVQLRDLLYITG